MSKKNLVTSGVVYTLGNLLLQGLTFITLPIYTRVISQEVFGQYSLYASWVSIFGLFIGLQTSGSFAVAKVKFWENYERYVAHCVSVSSVFFFFCFSVTFLLRTVLASWIGFSEQFLLLLVIQSFLAYLTGVLGTYFITYQKATLNLLMSGAVALSTTALSLFLVFRWEDNFMARVVGAFIPQIFSAIFVLIFVYRKGKSWIQKDYLKFTLTVSVPLIFHQLGHYILNQVDRVMISKWMTLSDVGLYSFGYNLGMLISLVLFNINAVWTPWFFEEKKKENPQLSNYISRYLGIAVFLTLGYLTIYPELAMIMGGDGYAASIGFIPLIIVSYFISFLYTFPVNIQFYHANTKTIPVGTLFAGLVNIGLNLILIPKIGIYGAAIATVLSYLALLTFHHLISRKRYAYTDVSAKTYVMLSSIVIVYAVVMGIFAQSLLIRWGMGICVIIFYGLYYKKDLQQLLVKFRKKNG